MELSFKEIEEIAHLLGGLESILVEKSLHPNEKVGFREYHNEDFWEMFEKYLNLFEVIGVVKQFKGCRDMTVGEVVQVIEENKSNSCQEIANKYVNI